MLIAPGQYNLLHKAKKKWETAYAAVTFRNMLGLRGFCIQCLKMPIKPETQGITATLNLYDL